MAALAAGALYFRQSQTALRLWRWRVEPAQWQGRAPCRILVLADLHLHLTAPALRRFAREMAEAPQLGAGQVVLLGLPQLDGGRLGDPEIHATLIRLLAGLAPEGARFFLAGAEGRSPHAESRLALLAEAGFRALDGEICQIGTAETGFRLGGVMPDHPAALSPSEGPLILLSAEPELFDLLPGGGRAVPVMIAPPLHLHGQKRPGSEGVAGLADRLGHERYPPGRYDESGRTLIVAASFGGGERQAPRGHQPRQSRRYAPRTPAALNLITIAEPEGW